MEKAEYFPSTSNTGTLDVFRKHDIVWSTMKGQLDVTKLAPTWAAYRLVQPLHRTKDYPKYQHYLHSTRENNCFFRYAAICQMHSATIKEGNK